MNYYFNGSEIFINKVTFLDKTICENYDYLHLSPIIVDETFDKNEIKFYPGILRRFFLNIVKLFS